jgi:transcriptional regulator with XRE-family HTH domain
MNAQPSLSRPLTIGEWISVLRHRKGWDQKTLADKADIGATHVSDIERGAHDPTYKTRRKLARALGVPVAELLDLEEDDCLGH